MECYHCKHKIADDSKFCTFCGKEITPTEPKGKLVTKDSFVGRVLPVILYISAGLCFIVLSLVDMIDEYDGSLIYIGGQTTIALTILGIIISALTKKIGHLENNKAEIAQEKIQNDVFDKRSLQTRLLPKILYALAALCFITFSLIDVVNVHLGELMMTGGIIAIVLMVCALFIKTAKKRKLTTTNESAIKHKETEVEILIEGVFGGNIFSSILYTLATIGFVALSLLDVIAEWDGLLIAIGFGLSIILVGIGIIISTIQKKRKLIVTNKKVIAIRAFGFRMELPIEKISSVFTCSFKGIGCGTSSAKILFFFCKNKQEVFDVIIAETLKRDRAF